MRYWIIAAAVLSGCKTEDTEPIGQAPKPPTEPAFPSDPPETIEDTDPPVETDGPSYPDYTLSGIATRPAQGTCVPPEPLGVIGRFPVAYEALWPGLESAETGSATMVVQHPTDDEVFFMTRHGYDWQSPSASALTRIERDAYGDWTATEVWEVPVLTSYEVPDGSDPDTLPDEVVLSGGGVLGLAVHPDFSDGDRYLYLLFTREHEGSDDPFESAVVQISLDASLNYVPGSATDLLSLPQPGPENQGGHLMFGQDGYLYISLGDGGAGNAEAAQDLSSLYGTVLRLDVDDGAPYAIPSDNPFVGNTEGWAEEIYAYGLQNPWKMDQSPVTGELYVADGGGSAWEELNRVSPGQNFGWPNYEGPACILTPCTPADFTLPTIPLRHELNGGTYERVIGGAFYDGDATPEWAGRYFFAASKDTPTLLTLDADNTGAPIPMLLDSDYPVSINALVRLRDGRVLILDEEAPYVLVPGDPDEDTGFPMSLSQTGCFDEDTLEPLEALIPFRVNNALWSDGASKRRWMVVPDGGTISIDEDGDFEYPVGSLLIKEFSLGDRKLETRFLVHNDDGQWRAYTYKWNEEQTDATIMREGLVEDVNGVQWLYPSIDQCLFCHRETVGNTLGLDIRQLNSFMDYDGVLANQLTTLQSLGLFAEPLPSSPEFLPAFPGLEDETFAPSTRARAYLHSNCSHCHHPGGVAFPTFDLRAQTPFSDMEVCDAPAYVTYIEGVEEPKVIAPSDPEASAVYHRIGSTDEQRMPLIASSIRHEPWIEIANAWIMDMPDCSGADADGDGTPDEEDGCPLDADAVDAADCP